MPGRLTFNLSTDLVLAAIARGDLDDDLEDRYEEVLTAIRRRILHGGDLSVGERVRLRAPSDLAGREGTVRVLGRGMACVLLDDPHPSAPGGEIALPHYALRPILIGEQT